METLLILAAATVAVLALAFVWVAAARDKRPPLRTRQEEEMIGDDEEGLIAAMTPAPASPIDRSAPILEITSIEAALRDARFIEGPADGRLIEGSVIEGSVVEAGAADDARREETGDEVKARPWKATDAGEPTPPPAGPTGRRPR